jgi:hypothetical protein
MVALTERLIGVEKRVEECVQPEAYKRTVSDVDILRVNIRSMNDRVQQQVARQATEQTATATQPSSGNEKSLIRLGVILCLVCPIRAS